MGKIVLTTGTFNIVHAGHIELFEFCNLYGKLFVGINSSEYLEEKYGTKCISTNNRIKVLSQLSMIEEIFIFEENTPCKLIEKVRPSYYVKGPDYVNQDIPELNILNELNIKFLIPNTNKILSTSNII